jgi:Secretion system C-terminal sorting domain
MKTIFKVKFLITSVLLLTFSSIFAHFNPVRTGNGIYGGTPTVFAIDPNYNALYLGSENGGVFWGQVSAPTTITSWVYRTLGLTSGKITSLAFYGTTSTVTGGAKVIAGTADAGVFYSRNRGVNWSKSSIGSDKITSLVSVSGYILAGTKGGGVFVSTDSAKTFSAATTQPSNLTVTSLVTDGSKVYAGTNGSGVFVSSDFGLTWSELNASLTSKYVVNCLTVYNSFLRIGTPSGVYSYQVNLGPTVVIPPALTTTSINSFSSNGNILFAATDLGVYASSNDGFVWNSSSTGFSGKTIAISPVFSGSIYAGTNNTGIYRSDASNISWSLFNTGFTNVRTSAVINHGNIVLAATENGVFGSFNKATSYALTSGIADDKNVTSFAFDGVSTFYAATKAGVIAATTINTLTTITSTIVWTSVGSNVGGAIKKLILYGNKWVVGLENGAVYSSTIGSSSWVASTGLGSNFAFTSLATDGVNIFASSLNKGVYISTDAQVWKAFNTGLTNTSVTSIAVAGNLVYAGTAGSGVFSTSVTTSPSWIVVNTSLASLNITSMAAAGKWVVAGFRGGINSIIVGNNTWGTPTNDNLPYYADVFDISFTSQALTNKIFVTTPYNAIYANSATELKSQGVSFSSVSDSENIVASIFESETESKIAVVVYPNPTETGAFTVSTLENDVIISKISVLNLTGTTLFSQSNENQLTNVSIEAALPKGLYFVAIATNKGKTVRKLLVK